MLPWGLTGAGPLARMRAVTDTSTVGERPGRSERLSTALAAFHARPVDGESDLLHELAMDAVLSRAARGELAFTAGRMLSLIVSSGTDVDESVQAMALLTGHPWNADDRRLLEAVLDAWWAETLHLDVGELAAIGPGPYRTPDEVLGVLAGYDAPMVRWFEPWLTELDGPGAVHLVDMVLDGLRGPAWAGKQDRADQVVGWARTEPVINGLLLIGGTHVDPERLSAALDRLI